MKKDKTPLFRRDFTLVVIGQIISLFGNAVLRFALPLYLLRETGSPALFGAVGAAALIPAVLCSPVGGVVADRVNKGRIMAALDFATAGLVLVFALLLGRLPLVPLMAVCLMLLYGIAGAYQPAVQASIPLLAGEDRLTSANAVINMVSTLSALLGPVAGGVLYGAFGIRPILWVSTACFLLSAVMELFLRIPHQPRGTEGGVLYTVGRDLAGSWRFIRRERPVFLSVTVVLCLFNLVLSAALIVGGHPGGHGAGRAPGRRNRSGAGGASAASPGECPAGSGEPHGGGDGGGPAPGDGAPHRLVGGDGHERCHDGSGHGADGPADRRCPAADAAGVPGEGDGLPHGGGELRVSAGAGGLRGAVRGPSGLDRADGRGHGGGAGLRLLLEGVSRAGGTAPRIIPQIIQNSP